MTVTHRWNPSFLSSRTNFLLHTYTELSERQLLLIFEALRGIAAIIWISRMVDFV